MLALESTRRRGALGAAVCAACSVLIPGLAYAQSAPPSIPAETPPSDAPESAPEPSTRPHMNLTGSSPMIDLTTPPPPAPVARKYRQHEGLYVRVGGGIGSLLSA